VCSIGAFINIATGDVISCQSKAVGAQAVVAAIDILTAYRAGTSRVQSRITDTTVCVGGTLINIKACDQVRCIHYITCTATTQIARVLLSAAGETVWQTVAGAVIEVQAALQDIYTADSVYI